MESVQPLRPYKRPATARQFKPGDPKVLRFFGKWVDTKSSKEGSKNTLYRAKVLYVIYDYVLIKINTPFVYK